jgi:glycosyltransferase 2 family protein
VRALRHGRLLARWLGWLAVAGSLGFVGLRLWQSDAWALASGQLAPLLAAVVGSALIYGLSGFLLSAGWRQVLVGQGPARGYHAVYGRTQIAKYLPGNCFHIVGRQVLGRALGHSQGALALASLLEAVLLLALAAMLATPLARSWLGGWALLLPPAAAGALALSCAVPRLLPAGWTPPGALRLLQAAACYGAFFIVAGSLLWLLAVTLAGETRLTPLTAVSALALAWIAGFVVPGSSAGLGVRETVLILALDGALDAQAGATVALALRLVTTLGDGVFCALALRLHLPPGADPSSQSKSLGKLNND